MLYFYIIDLGLDKSVVRIGYTTTDVVKYLGKRQRNSLVPLICIGVVGEVKGKEALRTEEAFIHRMLKNYLHHWKEVFWYDENSKKILDAYLKQYMSESDIKETKEINKMFFETWGNVEKWGKEEDKKFIENEPALECRYCHQLFEIDKWEEIRKHEKSHLKNKKKIRSQQPKGRHAPNKKVWKCLKCGKWCTDKMIRWHDHYCDGSGKEY